MDGRRREGRIPAGLAAVGGRLHFQHRLGTARQQIDERDLLQPLAAGRREPEGGRRTPPRPSRALVRCPWRRRSRARSPGPARSPRRAGCDRSRTRSPRSSPAASCRSVLRDERPSPRSETGTRGMTPAGSVSGRRLAVLADLRDAERAAAGRGARVGVQREQRVGGRERRDAVPTTPRRSASRAPPAARDRAGPGSGARAGRAAARRGPRAP